MDAAEVLAAYDLQVRQSDQVDGSGARVEVAGPVVRWAGGAGAGWCGITWSDLNGDTADAAIAAQVAYFAELGEEFEWKLYDYDRPADLARRLSAAGFAAEAPEALMVAEVAALPQDVSLPDGIRLLEVADAAGVGLLIDVHDRVFGTDHSRLHQSLLAQLRDAPQLGALVVAMAGGTPVCAARVEFLPGRQFASLWGGGTLPQWRGRGIYRGILAYRARLAAERGYRYLQVDASPDSRPILSRLGFVRLATTTPYVWRPPDAAVPD